MRLLYFLFVLLPFCAIAQQQTYVSIKTNYGNIIVRLSNETPLHRDNFIGKIHARYFDTTLFHRVVPNFVIQGGDPDSLFTTPTDTAILKAQRLMPEFHPTLFHKRGAFGMGRDDNPLKANFFTQIYIVTGRTYTDAGLDSVETRRMKGRKIPAERRQVFKTIGGIPQLDGDYTIFGEVVQGMEVVDAISNVTAIKELPVKPVTMKVRVLKKSAVRRLKKVR